MSVSVIIPFYNANKYLARAIKSCLLQTEVSQVIVVDDGSTDDGLSIAHKLEKEDTRIKVIQLDKNHGRSYARNQGLGYVDSEYFSFLDADDYYDAKRFVKTIATLEANSKIDGIYEAVKTAYEDRVKMSPFYSDVTMIQKKVSPERLLDHLLIGEYGYFSIIGVTLRSSLLHYRFDENLEIAEDTDYLWRIVRSHSLKGIHSNTISICRGVHGENTAFNSPLVVSNRAALYYKWVFEEKRNGSKTARKKLLRKYLYYQTLHNNKGKENQFFSKIWLLCKALFKKPSLLIDLF